MCVWKEAHKRNWAIIYTTVTPKSNRNMLGNYAKATQSTIPGTK